MCQGSLFHPDSSVTAARISAELLGAWAQTFDGEPVILPTIPGLPEEIPRVTLRDRAGTLTAEIAPARINISAALQADAQDGDALGRLEAIAQLLSTYKERMQVRVGRMAAVVHRCAADSTPGLTLARHFCRGEMLSGPLNRPENFEIHAHKVYSADSWRLNSWVRCKSALLHSNAAPAAILFVEQDLNTLAEEVGTKNYQAREIVSFFERAHVEFDTILDRYFPRGA